MDCRHCHELPASRPLQLCWKCYYNRSIRASYSTQSKYGRRGVAPAGRHPQFATVCRPGPDKVEILQTRAERGEGLWHEDDLTCDGTEGLALLIHRIFPGRFAPVDEVLANRSNKRVGHQHATERKAA